MNIRNVIGRKIVKVEQRRWHDERTGQSRKVVDRIVLDNGFIIYGVGHDSEDAVIGDILVSDRKVVS